MSDGKFEHDTGHLHRLVLFSDAVFAIAITLLAIELHPPEGWDHTVGGFFQMMGPKLVAFAISFAVIAINWIAHRRTFSRLVRADAILDVLNFVMLAVVVLTPFATEVLYDEFSLAAVGIYVFTVAAIGWAHGLVLVYAFFIGKLVDPTMPFKTRLFILFSAGITPGAMCALSFVSVAFQNIWGFIAMALWGVAIIWASKKLTPSERAQMSASGAETA